MAPRLPYGSHLRQFQPVQQQHAPAETPGYEYEPGPPVPPEYLGPNYPPQRDWPGPQAFFPDVTDLEQYRSLYRRIVVLYGGGHLARCLPVDFHLEAFDVNDYTRTEIRDNGAIIALDAALPSQTLEFFFPHWSILTGLTATVIAPKLSEWGQPEAGWFNNVDPRDYIFGQFSWNDRDRRFSTNRFPLSEIAGPRSQSGVGQFFEKIPFVPRGSRLNLEVSLLPPGWGRESEPPFVLSVAFISVTLKSLWIPELAAAG